MSMAMVTARVDGDRKREAEHVLRQYGRTYSDVIRDLTDYLVETGELPEFEKQTLQLLDNERKRRRIAQFEAFANRAMPPVLDARSDDELLSAAMQERYGDSETPAGEEA